MDTELRRRIANWVLRHRWLAAMVYSTFFVSPVVVFGLTNSGAAQESTYWLPLIFLTILGSSLVFLFWAFLAPRLIQRSLESGDWSWERPVLIIGFGVAISVGVIIAIVTA